MLSSLPSLLKGDAAFLKVACLVACTASVLLLLVAGTATTAISFPPVPMQCRTEREVEVTVESALDGNYKLVGPLLIMAGCFLLLLDIFLFAVIARDTYKISRNKVQVCPGRSTEQPVSLLGGPFYLAVPTVSDQQVVKAWQQKQMWVSPNAPPQSANGGQRGRSASVSCPQPPFNPEM